MFESDAPDRSGNGCAEAKAGLNRPSESDEEAEQSFFSTRDQKDELIATISRLTLSGARVGIAAYDLDLQYVLWNPFIAKMFGLPAEEVLGKRDSELFPFVSDSGLGEVLEQALTGESGACPDFAYFVPRSGCAGWASFTVEPLRDSLGSVIGVLTIVEDTTQLNLARQALLQSEDRYRIAVERAADVIYMVSLDCTVISLNHAFETITGWQRSDWIGESFLSLVHPDDLATATMLFQRVLRGEALASFELRFVSSNGEYLVGECSASPQVENGRVVSASGIVRDITARKRADEALRASNERFELIVQATNDAVWDWNLVTGAVWWSEGVKTLFGYQPDVEATEASRWFEQIHPDDRQRVLSGVQEILAAGGQSWFDEYRYQRADGTHAHVLDRGFVLRSVDGTPSRMIGAIMDVTDRRTAEKALQLAEEKYRSIFENAVEGIFQSTPDGRFITVNPSLVRMLGYESEQEVIENLTDIETQLYIDGDRRAKFQELLETQGTVQRFENQIYRKDGSILWISESGRAVRDSEGQILYFEGTIEDITSLKRAEAERMRLEEQLLQSQRIESLGLLAGGIAHDFNNLLTAIIGYSQLIGARLGEANPLNEELNQILDAGHRAAGLTGQLLAFSRRQTLIRRPISLNKTVANLMNMLQRIIGSGVEMRFREEPELQWVMADSVQIEQVIMNLAVNARDAMPNGGLLVIETRNVTLDEGYCRDHAWARPGRYVQISVSDAGVGMDPEVQRRIFEPFFTTKEFGEGTGLGLAVVYGIVKQHDGLIHVYSAPGHGTTFRIYLKALESGSGVRVDKPALPMVMGGNETVLVAEDEATLRRLANRVLTGLGYRVILAEDGQQAVELFERAANEIDLVILDLIMPRMGGREAYERIRALDGRGCPVIFMTGYVPEILKNELAGSQSAELIEKPYELDELCRKVRRVLDESAESAGG